MLKYLIIPLADSAISFCHYNANTTSGKIISEKLLKDSIHWSMKENLMIQFVYPKQILPNNILDLIDTVDHADIVPFDAEDPNLISNADIVVFDNWNAPENFKLTGDQSYVIRTSFSDLLHNEIALKHLLSEAQRVNVIITDIIDFNDNDIEAYDNFLTRLIPVITDEYKKSHNVQLNLLTDRLSLTEMNNCNAGYQTITLAPDGRFYICPAFYTGQYESVGDLDSGISVPYPQLYKISHAPICRICDAWQCRRCIWLNKTTTHEVNTPGHQQCVMAHIERNAGQKLLKALRNINPSFMRDVEIKEINYLDPLELIVK